MRLSKLQSYVGRKLRIPTWFFVGGWMGFIKTYIKWARGYYKHPYRRFKRWLYYKTRSNKGFKG